MVPWVTEKFFTILKGLQQRYKDSKGSERQEVIMQGIKDITASAEKDGVAIPANLKKKVQVWFQNSHLKTKQSSKTPKATYDGRVATNWTLHKVVKEQMSNELNALILTKDSSAHPGTKQYLTLVQGCLTNLIKGLSKERTQEFEELATLRNTVGVDLDLKAKQADKHFINVVKRFTEHIYKQMGVQVFMLVGYQNSEGEFVRTKVETDTFVPTKKQFTPIFNKIGDEVWDEWDKYLQSQADDDAEKNHGSTRKVIADKSVPWPLEHDDHGYPILPDIQGKSLPKLKDIVRSFVTLSYRHAAHNPKAVVPWKALVETPDKFLESCYLPAGVHLAEISKMTSKSLNACLRHWLESVENGEIAFRFKAVEGSHLRVTRSKRKQSPTISDDDAGPSDTGDHPDIQHGPLHDEDGDGSDDQQEHREMICKGKGKHVGPSCLADIPKRAEDQFEYLFSLSKEQEYVQLVKQAGYVQEESDATIYCQPAPKWVSWSYKKRHLSGRFHSSSDGFEEFIKWLKTMPYCTDTMKAYPQHRVLDVCLGIGMLLQDLHIIQFECDDESTSQDPATDHLKKSKLEWAHNQVLLEMCLTIADDLKACLDADHPEHSVTDRITEKRPPSKRQKNLLDSRPKRRSTRKK